MCTSSFIKTSQLVQMLKGGHSVVLTDCMVIQ
jgi:hypothetical protein